MLVLLRKNMCVKFVTAEKDNDYTIESDDSVHGKISAVIFRHLPQTFCKDYQPYSVETGEKLSLTFSLSHSHIL